MSLSYAIVCLDRAKIRIFLKFAKKAKKINKKINILSNQVLDYGRTQISKKITSDTATFPLQ